MKSSGNRLETYAGSVRRFLGRIGLPINEELPLDASAMAFRSIDEFVATGAVEISGGANGRLK